MSDRAAERRARQRTAGLPENERRARMTEAYRVWQPASGERAKDVRPIEADSAADAVAKVHRRDCEASDDQVYCVQRVLVDADNVAWGWWAGNANEMSRLPGGKVQVMTSTREYEPTFHVSDPLDRAALTARCKTCRRRFLDLDERRPKDGTCRRCGVLAIMAEDAELAGS